MVVVKDKLLDVSCSEWRGAQQKAALSELVLKSGEDRFAALKRLANWNGESPIVSLLAKVDDGTAKVTATEFVTGGTIFPFEGKLESFANFKLDRARHPDLVGVKISFNIRGENLQWVGCNAGRNTTGWLALRSVDAGVEFNTKEGNEFTGEGLMAAGLDRDKWLESTWVRLTLQHGPDANTMRVSACALYDDGKLPGWIDMEGKPELVPGLVLKVKGQEHRHRALTWLPMEKPEWSMGLARLPLLQLGADRQEVDLDHFPSRGELGRALFGHHRAMTKVLHARDRADLAARLAAAEAAPANQKIDFTWPEDRVVHQVTGRNISYLARNC